MNKNQVGRTLLLALNVATGVSALVADWSRPPLRRRRCPTSPKSHDGLTIGVGTLLGGIGICALRRKGGYAADNVRLAALCPAMFFTAVLAAPAYREADTIETEWPDTPPPVGRLSGNAAPFAASMLLLTAAAWKLADPTIRVHAVPPEPDDIIPMPAGA